MYIFGGINNRREMYPNFPCGVIESGYFPRLFMTSEGHNRVSVSGGESRVKRAQESSVSAPAEYGPFKVSHTGDKHRYLFSSLFIQFNMFRMQH